MIPFPFADHPTSARETSDHSEQLPFDPPLPIPFDRAQRRAEKDVNLLHLPLRMVRLGQGARSCPSR